MMMAMIISDIGELLSGYRLQDLGPLIFVGLWIVALVASLRGVDRRDEIAHVTYVCVMFAIGVVMFFWLSFDGRIVFSERSKLTLLFGLILVPSLRWMLERKRVIADNVILRSSANQKTSKYKKRNYG